jgi:hypothetical protein
MGIRINPLKLYECDYSGECLNFTKSSTIICSNDRKREKIELQELKSGMLGYQNFTNEKIDYFFFGNGNMSEFDAGVKEKISKIISQVYRHVEIKVASLTIEEIKQKPFDNALFSNNRDSLLFHHVMQRMTRSFSTKLGIEMESIAKEILRSSGATEIRWKREAQPFDIKFKHKNGEDEYWIEMKSIFGQNKSNQQTIDQEAEKASGAGKKFLLCVYNENKEDDEGVLSGPDFWNFIGNDEETWNKLSSILKNEGLKFDFESWAIQAVSRLKD